MLKELKEEKALGYLLQYLKNDIANCLYLYIDLWRYGLKNKNIRVWIEEMDGYLNMVIMKYHDSFQIYTPKAELIDDKELVELIELLKTHMVSRISGQKDLIRKIEPFLSNEYTASYGVIFCKKKGSAVVPHLPFRTEFAQKEDLPEIVDLLMSSTEFSAYYSKNELLAQMKERFFTKMGRSMIIRDGKKITGHIATFAEAEGLAVMSGSLVRKEYRNTAHFEILSENFDYILCNVEQRDVYAFVTDKRQIRLAMKLKTPCAAYGKLSKNNS